MKDQREAFLPCATLTWYQSQGCFSNPHHELFLLFLHSHIGCLELIMVLIPIHQVIIIRLTKANFLLGRAHLLPISRA
jgi:hypothetical protein